MADPKTKPVKRVRVDGNWQNLLLHLQNSPTDTFVLEFPDAKAARAAQCRLSSDLCRRSTWFTLLTVQRGSKIYVVNTRHAQRVVIDEKL